MPLTAYPGTDPLTNGSAPTNGTFLFPYPSGFGIFPTPLEATDGDDRSAGNLMLGLESVTDRTNYLGWRMIDWISGGTYTWTASVSLANDMTWVAVSNFTTTSQVNLEGATYVTGGSTGIFNIGNPILGSGVMRVRGNGIVTFDATSTIQGAPKFITKALFAPGTPLAPGIEVSSGAIVFTGTEPASGSNPGAPNQQYGITILKAYALIRTNGTGGYTLLDSYNINPATTLAGSPSALFFTIGMFQPMASSAYAPNVQVSTLAGDTDVYVANSVGDTATTTTFAFRVVALDGSGPSISSVDFTSSAPIQLEVWVWGRQ